MAQHAFQPWFPVLSTFTLLVLCGCNYKWEKTDPQRTGPVPEVTQIPAESFMAQWRRTLPIGNAEIRRITLLGDTLFVYLTDNRCYWVTRGAGHATIVSQVASATEKLYPPVQVGDNIVFPATNQLSVYDKDGQFLYKIQTPSSASSAAAVSGRTVFLGTENPNGGRVTAITIREQPYPLTPPWELFTVGEIAARPAVFDKIVYAGGRSGSVYAVRAANRAEYWPTLPRGVFKTRGEILAGIEADKDGVYVASMDSKLYCLDLSTGQINWIYYSGWPLSEESTPVITPDAVFIYVPKLGVSCVLKAGTQEIRNARWTVPEGRQVLSMDAQYVYLSSADGRIVAADRRTGQVKFRSQRNDFTRFATNLIPDDNTIYAATGNGGLFAVRPALRPGLVGELVLLTGDGQPISSLASH